LQRGCPAGTRQPSPAAARLQSPHGSQSSTRQHGGERGAVARCIPLAVSPPRDPERRSVAGLRADTRLRAADGVYRLWDHRRRRPAKLAGEDHTMKRPPAKKQPSPSVPAGKQHMWSIYHIKGTPAALLGRVEAPDEKTAIRKAIDEFQIDPALQK